MTTTKERMDAEALSDQTIRAAERAQIRAAAATPVLSPIKYVTPYDVKMRLVEALRHCGSSMSIPYKLLEEARAQDFPGEIDSETYALARNIDGIVISCSSTWHTLLRELVWAFITNHKAALEARQAAEEIQKAADAAQAIVDAATAKRTRGQFKRRVQ